MKARVQDRRTLALRMSASQRARLDRLARKLDRPRAALMREALDALISKYAEVANGN